MTTKINWAQLLDITYWLEGIAGGNGSLSVTPANDKTQFFFWFWLSLFAGFLILGVVLKITRIFLPENHPISEKLPFWSNNLIWMGVLGDLWFLFRQSTTVFLGTRLWLLVGFGWFSYLTFIITRYFLMNYPLEIQYYNKYHKNIKEVQKNQKPFN